MTGYLIRPFAAAIAASMLAACGGSATLPTATTAAIPLSRSAASRASSNAISIVKGNAPQVQDGTRLYASNWNNTITFPPSPSASIAQSLSVFDLTHNDAPLGPLPVGPLLLPAAIAFDRSDRLYLSDPATPSIRIFDMRRGSAPLPAITAGLLAPQGFAFDRHGRLYVADRGRIDVFDTLRGNAALPSIALGSVNPRVIALDTSDRLYYPGAIGEIAVLDTEHGNTPLTSIGIGTPGALPNGPIVQGLIVDDSGKLYVSGGLAVHVYDTRRSNASLDPITADGLSGAGMAIDERGRLYVADFAFGSGSTIYIFDTKDANRFLGTLSGNGMEGVSSLAVQRHGG